MFSLPGTKRAGGGLRGLFGGLISGALLLLFATGVLFWNEGRTVKRTAVLAEGKVQVKAASADALAPENEGQLVHVRAELAASGENLGDPDFGVESEGLALRRRVEMYQWEEKKSRKSGNQQGYDFRYEQTWSDSIIDDSVFEQRSGHENPDAMPWPSAEWSAVRVQAGAYVLASDVLAELRDWRTLRPDEGALPPNLAASLRREGEFLTSAEKLGSPRLGDLRIRFEEVPLGPVSLIAAQQGEHLRAWQAKQGELLLVERGDVNIEGMFEAAATRNSQLGWALRAGGFAAFWLGFGLMLRPISGVLGNLPVIGGIGRMVTSVVAGLLALSLSVLTIVSGWLFHRPWLLGVLLIGMALAIIWLARRPRAPTAATPSPSMMPPPPPPAP